MLKMILINKKNRKNKKGFMKIVEVVLAFVFTYFFITFALPNAFTDKEIGGENVLPLQNIPDNELFRTCTLEENIGCLNNTMLMFNPDFDLTFRYNIFVLDNPKDVNLDFPDQKIFVDSKYIAGNLTKYEPKIVRMYFWKKTNR